MDSNDFSVKNLVNLVLNFKYNDEDELIQLLLIILDGISTIILSINQKLNLFMSFSLLVTHIIKYIRRNKIS